ncbi:hypothetical protein P8C59_008109 [Phyllachora maydis]|uniref:CAF1B/HIR1 beta-propeller domain-containing protein n=1 Tax=Phyllachora maydis TaxID=1825666 RepID=A0AAD9I9T8_9PEZI|nr:hypothetical protein P8C59_008109 [Phyllachora maydis]
MTGQGNERSRPCSCGTIYPEGNGTPPPPSISICDYERLITCSRYIAVDPSARATMRATPLIINWHNQNSPIYSAHFEPGGKGRLATAAGDTNVRLWKLEGHGEERKVEYLSTLVKHTQAVNVVRWAPKGEVLASAGDDGNVILWVPSDNHLPSQFGSDGLEDKETWRTKHMCRSSGAEIYDLAWSPDATYFIIGSMDNIAKIYNAGTGTLIRQIAEHSHYVQGVAWDPLNEFIATQSSDRSVHVYSLKTKDGQYSLHGLDDRPQKVASHVKADLPHRRISSHSPAPPDMSHRSILAALDAAPTVAVGSPAPSAPGTPTSLLLMNPPSVMSHSRKSSFSSRRSVSPAPSLPLPAVMPMDTSPKPAMSAALGVKNASLYANEALTSFFRRLTFTPDGSLLLTPAGQYQIHSQTESGKSFEVINTVYIYTRGGINKQPIAHLPGHKKPSVAEYHHRHFVSGRASALPSRTAVEAPVEAIRCAIGHGAAATAGVNGHAGFELQAKPRDPEPMFVFGSEVYICSPQTPICAVSNLHLATFTDLAWSSDGLTLLISSSDGFCSVLSFSPGELGQTYSADPGSHKNTLASTPSATSHSTPAPTPTSIFAPPSPYHTGAQQGHRNSSSSRTARSPPPTASFAHQQPTSPARSNSTSSVMTQASAATCVISNPPLIAGHVPSIAAAKSGKVTGVPVTTPPETPRPMANGPAGTKRDTSESEMDEAASNSQMKRRRIAAPTTVPKSGTGSDAVAATATTTIRPAPEAGNKSEGP